MTQENYGLLLSVRTDHALKSALKEVARREHLTLTQVVLKALRTFLEADRLRNG